MVGIHAMRGGTELVPQDATGAETLERLVAARNYNRWLTDRLQRWVGRRVLEIGAGLGSMSEFILDRERVVLSDTDPYYLARLRERFAARPNVRIAELRLPGVDGSIAAERLDTVICLNVLEHVPDDVASLVAMRTLLHAGGGGGAPRPRGGPGPPPPRAPNGEGEGGGERGAC